MLDTLQTWPHHSPPLPSSPFLAYHNASSIHKMIQLDSITKHRSLLFPSVGRGKCIYICTCLASRFVPLGCIVNCAVKNSLILISHFYKHYPINSCVFEHCITLCCLCCNMKEKQFGIRNVCVVSEAIPLLLDLCSFRRTD